MFLTGINITKTHRAIIASLFCLTLLLSGCGGGGGSSDTQTVETVGVELSGVITPASNSQVDGDTNDPLSPNRNNDSSSQAQVLPNPVILGGFASSIGTGNPGDRFATAPDSQDWYRLVLAEGQTIVLQISDHDGTLMSPDLDLYLTTISDIGTPVQFSKGYGPEESITVAASGEYYLLVQAYDGVSNYLLSVGQQVSGIAVESLRIEDDFVPGELIVRFKETPVPPAARAAALNMQTAAGGHNRAALLRLGDESERQITMRSLGVGPSAAAEVFNPVEQRVKLKQDTIRALKALRQRDDVVSADLNYIRRPFRTPADEFYSFQWHYPLINLPQAWDVTTGDSSVVVAVVDTGVLMDHPDLDERLCRKEPANQALVDCKGYDFISRVSTANDGDGIDDDPNDPGDEVTPGASSFHGTHVAGTIGAESNSDGPGSGVAGVDWNARIMPLRALGVGGGTSYDIMESLAYAAGLENDSGEVPSKTADVINLSFGGGGYSQTEQNLYNQLHDLGIIVVAAAGNNSTSSPAYPASYDNVLSVGAVDLHKQLAHYSNYGPLIDLVAPGGDTTEDDNGDGYGDGVLSALGDDSGATFRYVYDFYQGTSMAAPHVAGVVALMKDVYPALTPAELDSLIAAGSITEDLSGDGPTTRNNTFGYGMIDAQKAVLTALAQEGGAPLPASLGLSPSSLNFGSYPELTKLTTVASNLGEKNLTVVSVTENVDWITSVTLIADDGQGVGLGTYEVVVDRNGLEDAVYNALIRFETSVGLYTLPVTMQVGAGSSAGNAGFQWVLLLDTDSGEAIKTTTAELIADRYQYSFTDVPPGQYQVISGTDSDNDGYVCDSGESCGGYPLVSELNTVPVDAVDVTGIDFTTGFNISPATGDLNGPGMLSTGAAKSSGKGILP